MNAITRKPIDGSAWTLRSGTPFTRGGAVEYRGRDKVFTGPLVLVNAAHPVREFETRLEAVTDDIMRTSGREEPDIALDASCLAQLSALLGVCGGRNRIAVVSGYRSKETQANIYRETVRDRGRAYAASYVALPGASEHQTGLAVDVGLFGQGLDYIAPAFPEDDCVVASFRSRAAEYGFIQRYRADKTPITGIAAEPWHYRYVGFPHAAIMAREELCLEEYTDFVKRHPYGQRHLFYEQAHCVIEIYYVVALHGRTAVPVPGTGDSASWDISGNNADGFVVTAVYDKEPDRHGR